MGIFKSNQEAIYVLTTENFRVRYDHLEMDWFKDKLLLMKTMILIHIFSGGPARGRVDEGAGEVEGNHRGAGADLCRDVRILKGKFAQIHLKLKRN